MDTDPDHMQKSGYKNIGFNSAWLPVLVVVIFCFPFLVHAQTCNDLGQNPSTAFPVCGTAVFHQSTVAICGNRTVPGPCSSDPISDKNPYWYKFTCFKAGTLGFVITPMNLSDDYDWQLFDVTGRGNLDDIYTDPNLFVACNWSGEGGKTGAAVQGKSLEICAGYGKPLYSAMPTLKAGHKYILLISHFTDSQSGYDLEFTGGSANITDPADPHLGVASANCDGLQISLLLNKKMRCNTLSTDGSEFTLSSGGANIIKAIGNSCAAGFDLDTVTLTLDKALVPGNYQLAIKNGKDGNTILDFCDRNIPENESVDFTVFPLQPTPMDSIYPLRCSPSMVQLLFKKPMKCSSIAPDGSDFTVTGPSTVTVTGAVGFCEGDGGTSAINVNFSGPIVTGGVYTVTLKRGSDGNTIFDECAQETPVGSAVDFTVKDTVSAVFSYQLISGCKTDTLRFNNEGKNGIDSWRWTFDNTRSELTRTPVNVYTTTGDHLVSLIVSNGFCSDTVSQTISLEPKIKAAFTGPDILCPKEAAVFVDASIGKVTWWNWDFGNGYSSNVQNPPPQNYLASTADRSYPIRLVTFDAVGCTDTVVKKMDVVVSCVIAVPNAFTPNGDGHNDYLYPSNIYKADNLLFRVFNRYGQMVFQSRDMFHKWDGTLNGRMQDPGVYVWTLQYTLRDTGKSYSFKGTTVLIR
jgi:gliding motility-associated-like protein